MDQTSQTPVTQIQPQPISSPPLPLKQVKKSKPGWLISLLLIIFPPVAIYFMYTDEKYHPWLAKTNISVGVSMLILLLSQILFVNQKLSGLYTSLNVTNPLSFLTQICEVGSLLFLLVIVISIWALRIKKDAKEYRIFLNCMLILLILSLLLSTYITNVILVESIKPIYSNIGTFAH